jgi:hypothetical protein
VLQLLPELGVVMSVQRLLYQRVLVRIQDSTQNVPPHSQHKNTPHSWEENQIHQRILKGYLLPDYFVGFVGASVVADGVVSEDGS